jgi:hydroxyacylglutathione hydrolase
MAHIDTHQFICREDNYGVLLHDQRTGATASIDAPDAAAVERELKNKGWQLTHIFTTHHHGDHVEGNIALKERFGCTIIGPGAESTPIPGIDRTVAGGDTFQFAGREVRVIDTPGHTRGHISYYIPEETSAFVGDTLFALGCGRVVEGTMDMMWQSLDRLRSLPPATTVYVGHEYTEANARFALTIEPQNRTPQQRRLLRCKTCKARFSERKGTPLFGAQLPEDKAVALLHHIAEGVGVRKTSRLVGVNRNTVVRYCRLAGDHAQQLHDELVAFSPQDP